MHHGTMAPCTMASLQHLLITYADCTIAYCTPASRTIAYVLHACQVYCCVLHCCALHYCVLHCCVLNYCALHCCHYCVTTALLMPLLMPTPPNVYPPNAHCFLITPKNRSSPSIPPHSWVAVFGQGIFLTSLRTRPRVAHSRTCAMRECPSSAVPLSRA